ncbi:MAG: ECF-type sigma factor [Verrucomicrobiota bacterium]
MNDYTHWLNASKTSRDDEVFEGLYGELHRIARGRMANERSGATLNPTALVNEAWMRLEKSAPEQWRDRKQFYAAASEAMRRILIEAARRRLAARRGGEHEIVPLDDEVPVRPSMPDERLLGVHEVLDDLEREDDVKAQIVKLRFFSGMTHREIAALLEVSEPTVRRHWALAKVWLYEALHEAG